MSNHYQSSFCVLTTRFLRLNHSSTWQVRFVRHAVTVVELLTSRSRADKAPSAARRRGCGAAGAVSSTERIVPSYPQQVPCQESIGTAIAF